MFEAKSFASVSSLIRWSKDVQTAFSPVRTDRALVFIWIIFTYMLHVAHGTHGTMGDRLSLPWFAVDADVWCTFVDHGLGLEQG